MKRFLQFQIVSLALCVQAAAELGSVTATTIVHGNKTTTTFGIGTRYTSQTKESGVLVHFGPMKKDQVSGPYEVQCFFLSRAGGKQSIHAAYRQVSDLPYDAEFYSQPIAGKSSSTVRTPVEVQVGNRGATLSGVATSTTSSKGSMAAGWIVRVFEAGKIARVEASTVELKEYATQNPELFDKRASTTTPMAPSDDRKPASGFGNTLLDAKPTQNRRK